MNKEEPYREQAERLKKRIEKINEAIELSGDELPPREQLHRERKTKVKWKLKYPVIRILVLFFILMPVIIFSVISYLDGKKSPVSEPASNDPVGYETINLETKSEETKKAEEEETQPAAQQENQESTEAEETTPDSQPVTAQPAENNDGAAAQNTGSEAAPVSGTSTDKNSQPIKKTPVNQTKSKIIYHKVQPKETLFRLSMKYYNSQKGMEIIKKANGLTSEEIMEGQMLKIPLN